MNDYLGGFFMTNRKVTPIRMAIGVLVCVLCTASISRADILDGLVSYWPFDGDLTDARDDNDGTLMGTDTSASFTPGMFGTGIDLDGVDQFVDITGGDESEFDFTGGDVSISTWFRVDGFTKNWQALIAKGESDRWRVARRSGENIMSYAGGVGDIPGSGVGPDVNDGGLHR